MSLDFDYIVIGSGFGGSVMTCRLMEKGYKVCLLERGRQWKMHEFPRRPEEVRQNMFWDPRQQKYGLMEIRDNPESDVASITAAGLGGGSLIYANVLYRMPAEFFKAWPGGYTRERLEPFYDQVTEMMEAKPYPYETDSYYRNTPKTGAIKAAAEHLNKMNDANLKPQFVLPPLAVRFEGKFPGEQSVNSHGALQSKCNKCGDCDIGCNIHAKNTLDLNYLYRAQKGVNGNKAEIRTHAEVVRIEHHDDHYKVIYILPEFPVQENTLTAKEVILSAGSIGSTSLLLKMKKQGVLPKLNAHLGKKWAGNGDLIAWIFNTKDEPDATKGPVITGSLEYPKSQYPDGFPHGMYLQEAGYPMGIAWYLSGKIPQVRSLAGMGHIFMQSMKRHVLKLLKVQDTDPINIGHEAVEAVDPADFTRKCFLILGMGRDKSDGEIKLRADNQAIVKWKIDKSRYHFDRLHTEMKKIADFVKGVYMDSPLLALNKVISVHPLGGCPMGDNANQGVVSPLGEVYGYKGLHVIDGSILPTSTGTNPSLTIAAIAEYIATTIPNKLKVEEQEKVETDASTV